MKMIKKNKSVKHRNKPKAIVKPKKEKVLIVAQEIKFARLLSGNDKKTRDRVLKTMKKWLYSCFEKCYEFKEEDFLRVWKGLFYAVWMSDKPLVQEDLCESISEILDLFPEEQLKYALMMTKAGFKVLATEWYGIDNHRMDKFLMLVRRYLRGSFRCLLRSGWSLDSCKKYADMIASDDSILALKTPVYARNAMSLILHITDCYLEELAKVSRGEIPEASLAELLRPFTAQVCGGEALSVCMAARRLLTQLVRHSELGLEYQEKERAWQEMGCPAGGPDALEPASDDEQPQNSDAEDVDDEAGPLDPRAGRVSVTLRPLPVPAALLAAQLRQALRTAAPRAIKRAKLCLHRFEELANNRYPLKLPEEEVSGAEADLPVTEPERAAARLRSLERQLVASTDELALRGLRRKHRKRLLARSRAGISLIDELGNPPDTTNGKWKVEDTQTEKKQNKGDSNKENVNKKKDRKRKLNDSKGDDNVKAKRKLQEIKKDEDQKVSKKNNKVVNKNTVTPKQVKVQAKTDNAQKKSKPTKSENNIQSKESSKKIPISKPTKVSEIEKSTPKKVLGSKVKNYQKQLDSAKKTMETPKKVKFVLKNNSMQGPVDYYKSVRESPSIPFDSSKKPTKTNLKPSTPSPINPFFKKKLRLKN
ncbi:ribosomal RNA processing protein 1 homolog [Aricia agestis]|uniref:ribosomal RNA processing protein 1 homolog n=1 Tax=Aricia agestis TaxID=91739 RepID=UPI001C2089A8|nr:ribosomal RNA processing protein 1 homolog [Aricia agestis]